MAKIPFSPGAALDAGAGAVCWAAALLGKHLQLRPGRINHVANPPGPAFRESRVAASTSPHCVLSSWDVGEQEAAVASLAVGPCPRDGHSQSPLYK